MLAAGSLTWEHLSDSSEDELSPRQVSKKKTDAGLAYHPDKEEDRQANGHTAKAGPPEPAAAFAKLFSLADSIAFGTKEMAERLQVCLSQSSSSSSSSND